MDLRKEIKQRRKKQQEKRLILRDAYSQVSCIVQLYGLDQDFMDLLDHPDSSFVTQDRETVGARLKAPMDCPPFNLGTEEEYALTTSIIRTVGNPYLRYATSPDEILLARPLYRLNAAIPAERLMRFHFGTLLHYELTRPATRHGPRNRA